MFCRSRGVGCFVGEASLLSQLGEISCGISIQLPFESHPLGGISLLPFCTDYQGGRVPDHIDGTDKHDDSAELGQSESTVTIEDSGSCVDSLDSKSENDSGDDSDDESDDSEEMLVDSDEDEE